MYRSSSSFSYWNVAIDGLKFGRCQYPACDHHQCYHRYRLGEYSVKSGWFNSETMLYMAFVTIANYSQASFELGYTFKFMRMILAGAHRPL